MILHGHVLSAETYAVRLALALAGLAATHRVVDWPGGETDAPAFRALSPEGALPVLDDGAVRRVGMADCLRHLAERPGGAQRLLPDDPADRAEVERWLAFAAEDLAAARRLRAARLFDRPIAPELRRAARRAFVAADDRLIEQGLRGRRFLATDAETIADVAAFPILALADDVGLPLDGLAGIGRYVQTMTALDGFVAMPGIFALPAEAPAATPAAASVP